MLTRGFAFVSLLAVAVIVAIVMASGVRDQVGSLGASPASQQVPAAAATVEP